jgi:hypothetical protein
MVQVAPGRRARPSGRAVSKDRLGSWDGLSLSLSQPPFVRKGVPHGQTESGGIVLAVIIPPLAVICWAHARRGGVRLVLVRLVLPHRALYLPTFSHFLIVNKLLSPSLSPSPSSATLSCTPLP